MKRDLARFSKGQYDLLVIGGGINGSAIAHLAAQRGLKVALLEKGDFASGTSSKSTKLVHGGLRYLEQLEFSLVRESLRERHIQLQAAPHLVKPLGFVIPVYKSGPRPLWKVSLGVRLYDLLSGKYCIEKARTLSVDEIRHFFPDMEREGLRGGVIYYDAQMDDARLCLENVLRADELGAHVANYVEVKSFIKKFRPAIRVRAVDLLTGQSFEVGAQKIVCAAGPWSDLLRKREDHSAAQKVRATKGVHVVVKERLSRHAVFIPAQKDNRLIFVIPWREHSLIGTTDTDYSGDPNNVEAREEDIEYLLSEVRRVFPAKNISKENILTTFAGLRPLVFREGQSPSDLSRKHSIIESYSGVFYVIGGKYTTYRKIAEDCLKRILPPGVEEGKGSRDFVLYSSELVKDKVAEFSEKYGMEKEVVEHLVNCYGRRVDQVLGLIALDERLKERICLGSKVIRAQIVFSKTHEMAQKAEDVLLRRSSLSLCECLNRQCEKEVNKIMSDCS